MPEDKNNKFDLDLSATTEKQVVIGKVKLSDDPERIVDVYSPDTKYYTELLKFQRKVRALIPLIAKQEKGNLDLSTVDEKDLDAALSISDDIMKLVKPLIPDLKKDEEVNIDPVRAGQLLQWILQKSANQETELTDPKAQVGDAEKKTEPTTSQTE